MNERFHDYQASLLSVENRVWQSTVAIMLSLGSRACINGNGFYIASDLIVTTAHSMQDTKGRYDPLWLAQYDIVHPFNRTTHKIAAIVVDPTLDLALVRLEPQAFAPLHPLCFAEQGEIAEHQKVIVPDLNPPRTMREKEQEMRRLKSLLPAFREGKAHRKTKIYAGGWVRLFNLGLRSGHSGSPIVHKKTGEVVSIVTSGRFVGEAHDSFAIYGPRTENIRAFIADARAKLDAMPSGIG